MPLPAQHPESKHLDVRLQPDLEDVVILRVRHPQRLEGQLVALDGPEVPDSGWRLEVDGR